MSSEKAQDVEGAVPYGIGMQYNYLDGKMMENLYLVASYILYILRKEIVKKDGEPVPY